MLKISKKIKDKKSKKASSTPLFIGAFVLLGCGIYLLTLVAAPAVAPIFTMKPIDVKTLPKPTVSANRIIIPKIGVNIEYGQGTAALDRGAEWRSPSSGNPADGGNFVIAAHRFSIQATPQATVEKSPFYHIDRMAPGDKIVIDYEGKRYGYEIVDKFTVKPTQVEIEERTDDSILTLYSCGLGGSEEDRLVLKAKRLGELTLN